MLCSTTDHTCSDCQQVAAAVSATEEPLQFASGDPASRDPTPPGTPQDDLRSDSHSSPRRTKDPKMVFGIDKVLLGIVKYHQTVRTAMVEQFRRVRDNPVVCQFNFNRN
jgi:hypothetical protein